MIKIISKISNGIKKILIILLTFLVVSLGISLSGFTVHSIETAPEVPINQIDMQNWMGQILNGNQLVSVLSIPGTHDSAAYNGTNWFGIVRTQTMTIPEQLNSGIRFLDLRVAQDGSMHHGSVWVGAWGGLAEHLDEVRRFLDAHPTEFVIMRIKNEDFSLSSEANRDAYYQSLMKAFAGKGPSKFSGPGVADYIYLDKSHPPKVKDVRGKILIIDDSQGMLEDWAQYEWWNIFIQDRYKGVTADEKLEAVKSHANAANNELHRLTINFLSYTSGLSNIQDLGREMNKRFNTWLSQVSPQYDVLGILPMDVPSTDVIRNIVNINQHARPLFELLEKYEELRSKALEYIPTDVNKDGIIDVAEKAELDKRVAAAKVIKDQLENELKKHKDNVGETAAVIRVEDTLEKEPLPDTSQIKAFDVEPYITAIENAEKANVELAKLKSTAMEDGIITKAEKDAIDEAIKNVQDLKDAALKMLRDTFPTGTKKDSLIARAQNITPLGIADKSLMSIALENAQKIYDGERASYEDTPIKVSYTDDKGTKIKEDLPNFVITDVTFSHPLPTNGNSDTHLGDVSEKAINPPTEKGVYNTSVSPLGMTKIANYAKSKGIVIMEGSTAKAKYNIQPRTITLTASDQELEKSQLSRINPMYTSSDNANILASDIAAGKIAITESLSETLNPDNLVPGQSYDDALVLSVSGTGANNYNFTLNSGRLTIKETQGSYLTPDTGLSLNSFIGFLLGVCGVIFIICLVLIKKIHRVNR